MSISSSNWLQKLMMLLKWAQGTDYNFLIRCYRNMTQNLFLFPLTSQ
jgi:hypothetical protein